ncbi:hypothetical protein EJB05_04371 [Eragrostis curvula]|uniref:ATP-dependent DNA helicase n=1 Tax=Eragrostis curvula TaxID=38414 RepID=A0A5J9W9T4_9POAL|nr:hypothetical protein EJB05_04371 [Eragrostis curvula]
MDGHRGKRRLDSADDAEGQGELSVMGSDLQSLGGLNYKPRCVPAHEGPGFRVPSRQKASRRLMFVPDDASSLPAARALANEESAACADEQQTADGLLPTHCGVFFLCFPGPSLSLTAEARRNRKAYMDARRPTGLRVVDRSYSSPSVQGCANNGIQLNLLSPVVPLRHVMWISCAWLRVLLLARRKRKAFMLATKPPGSFSYCHGVAHVTPWFGYTLLRVHLSMCFDMTFQARQMQAANDPTPRLLPVEMMQTCLSHQPADIASLKCMVVSLEFCLKDLELYNYGAGIMAEKLIPHTRHECSTSLLDTNTRYQSTIFTPLYLGGPTQTCQYCGARFCSEERVRGVGSVASPVYNKCCKGGSIFLPPYRPPPEPLLSLLNGQDQALSRHFYDNIRRYNAMFAMTSMGVKVIESINDGRGPYVFKISGQLCHRIGSLIPPPDKRPEYCQLYIFDTVNEVRNRMAVAAYDASHFKPNEAVVRSLVDMFDTYNPIVKLFRTARNRLSDQPNDHYFIKLFAAPSEHGNVYSAPVASEVVGLVVNDLGTTDEGRDLVVEDHASQLQRVKETHCKFMAMQYPILFPYGEDGFHENLKYRRCHRSNSIKRKDVTMLEYFAYRLHDRAEDFNTPLRCKRLTQSYEVDAFCCVEHGRLSHYRTKSFQLKYRTCKYKALVQAVSSGVTEASSAGQRVILPSSCVGTPRYYYQNYQDCVALCRRFGCPDLFITFTCNAAWPEIQDALSPIPGQHPSDRPDIVDRVFEMKLKIFMDDIIKKKFFGPITGVVYTIEFQKRGLPHVHLILWLQKDKPLDADQIDTFISAQLPDQSIDPIGFDVVSKFMIHGPCGTLNPSSPCMADGECTKFYPKEFCDKTTVLSNGHIRYARPENGITTDKNDVNIDNRFVVPQNVDLLVKYQAHINVEAVNRDAWRLLEFDIHHTNPAVERLPVHLPLENNVLYTEEDYLEEVIENSRNAVTKLTAWFEANRSSLPHASEFTYVEFPEHFTWHADSKYWAPRHNNRPKVGRIANVAPNQGEPFYLRMLLHIVKGARYYSDLRTVAGQKHQTFHAACEALGLLGDDREWSQAMTDASYWALPYELRELFVTLLLFSQVTNPAKLFDEFAHLMGDDIRYRINKLSSGISIPSLEQYIRSHVLLELEKLLKNAGYILAHFHLPQPEHVSPDFENRLIIDELAYASSDTMVKATSQIGQLNANQKYIFDAIVHSVLNNHGDTFFVYGYGGTGKTFLWNALLNSIRSQGKIALAVASSGIAALLLPGGRTPHSRFKIPLNIHEHSVCSIRKHTHLSGLIEQTSLIIWDEAPVNHKHCFEALDRTLRDIMSSANHDSANKQFGGITVVLGGDFRQTLPVIPNAKKQEILAASITRSYLWHRCKLLQLTENMRLKSPTLSPSDRIELEQFAQWLLSIGDGTVPGTPTDKPNTNWVQVPEYLLLPPEQRNLDGLISFVYRSEPHVTDTADYLCERAILAPTNEVAATINEQIIKQIATDEMSYYSCDSIDDSTPNYCNTESLYPTEFLNTIQMSGLPDHCYSLKWVFP